MPSEPAVANSDSTILARDAFIWGLPLVLMERSFQVSEQAGLPVNQLFITTELAIPQFRQIGPNVDTLIGHAWLDLSQGPIVIGVPDTNDRYYSIQLQDMYMDTFDYIGRRATGTKAGHFAITSPGFEGALPAGVTGIPAPTSKVLAYIRTMLRDPQDLEAALGVHTAYTLGPLSAFPDYRTTPIAKPDRAKMFPHVNFADAGAPFFDELDRLVRIYPPLNWDAPNLARFAPLGIGGDTPRKRDAKSEAELAEAVGAGYEVVRSSINITRVNGWARRDNVPAFIHDPVQRAANNFFGKGTHRSDEAIYWGTRQGGVGPWLNGANRYRMRFAAGQTPPVDAFWSLTVYDKDYVLFGNPLGRYAILDRTKGLQYGADGSLDILIQADEPDEGTSNWLPAPRAEFQMNLRAYQPGQSVIDGTYLPPPVEIVNS
ncbi:MAG: DUF1254 domain-containing protein [Novosphingobium sp.]|nr:DUF1254 domain-containing protein [Novosphingobium sp.]